MPARALSVRISMAGMALHAAGVVAGYSQGMLTMMMRRAV